MLITRIELENIKSYRQLMVDFRRGTTAISGANGSGKTTIVEAIGFALFDYLPYSQARFVREGEKFGRVVVHLIGGDERPYTVERRCGSGSRWFIFDEEANARIEQSADVQDKLHELFGIDRERPFDSLFRDALGVPQGTFTAIFLEPGSKRKQTFDALLQIEDYKHAADYLLDAQKQYREQMQEQQLKINQLTYETRELETWRADLREARRLDEQWKQQNALWTTQLSQHEEQLLRLVTQLERLQKLKHSYESSKAQYEHAQGILVHHELQLQQARSAQQIVTASTDDHRNYQEAEKALQELHRAEQQRSRLRQQQSKLQSSLAATQANISNLQARLEEVAHARDLIVELAPLVEQQIALELRRDDLRQKVTLYASIVNEGKQLSNRLTTYQQKQKDLEQKIAEITPLLAIADRLPEQTEALTQLQIQRNERKNKTQQVIEKRNQLQEKQNERELCADKLRKAERSIAQIEEHRQEAEEMPILQERYNQFAQQRHRLEGSITSNSNAKEQSAGGQCPLLHESCLNIKQRGIVSLESYFDGLLEQEHAQVAAIAQQQDSITERMTQIKKYVEWLSKLGLYTDKREGLAEQLQRIAIDITRLERDVAGLSQELDTLKTIDQQISEIEASYKESKQADAKVRELPGLSKQVQQFQEQIRQGEADLQERRQQADSLRGSDAQLKRVSAEIEALNDPRTSSKAQQDIIAQEGRYQQQLQAEQQRSRELHQQLQSLQEQLTAYETLDSDIAMQELQRQHSYDGYQNYLKHVEVAYTLPTRESDFQRQSQMAEDALHALQQTELAFQEAEELFDQSALDSVKAEIDRLRADLVELAGKMQRQQEDINALEKKITQAEALLIELQAAQKEHQELDDLHTMMEYFRKLIKEAAPHVLKAMLNDISAEANRIFGEIMGDRSAQLTWQNDYEVVLRRQGVNRTFAQLSGGEQMSAALAVRLALLKKLSTLNIAFFDEPTQNMDELRRMNLADQIRRVRGFDQLIVISHDDTFEQGLDSLLRLRKDNGETHLLDENETPSTMNDESTGAIYAS
jgi:DNA repair protein SbcC/Rad50